MGQIAVDITPAAVWAQLREDWLVVGTNTRCRRQEITDGDPVEEEGLSWKGAGKSWIALIAARREQLTQYANTHTTEPSSALIVMVADADPVDFLASIWAALLSDWSIALANAKWGRQEWQSAYDIVQPHMIWSAGSNTPQSHQTPATEPNDQTRSSKADTHALPAILIPTGGSSGQIKFAHHTWQTLVTSVTGFHQHFFPTPSPRPTAINAYCVLPLYHVSGLLQALRTALTNGQLFLTPFKNLSFQASAFRPQPFSFISLVPTQLSRLLLTHQTTWLSQFHAVLLGGAPPWPSLLEQAIVHNLPLYLSYGMTETAAMVSATHPNRLRQRQGPLGSGHVMPHAMIKIERAGQSLAAGAVGQVVVRSGAIALGYYNAPSPGFTQNTFYTDDLGHLDTDGTLHITGRASGKIISGGENIFPAEVETALRNTGQVRDVCVVGLPHSDWGEAVSAAYVPTDETVSPKSLKAALISSLADSTSPALSQYKVPKYWFSLSSLPRNKQGKINRSALLAQLKLAQRKTLSNLSAQAAAADGDGF